ncbi:MAG: PAS domain-containing protein [Anaerolineae bacterium]
MPAKNDWLSVSPISASVLALIILGAALFATILAMGDIAIEGQLLALLRLLFLTLIVACLFVILAIYNIRRLKREHIEQEAELIRTSKSLSEQLKNNLSELNEERTQSKTILQSMSEAVLLIDQRHIKYMNRALGRLTGYNSEDLIGKPLTGEDSIPVARQLADLQKMVAIAIAQGGMWQGQFQLIKKDSTELDVNVIGLPLEESPSHAGQILLLIRDNSMEKKLQAQKTNFVTNASHELRTPSLVSRCGCTYSANNQKKSKNIYLLWKR